MNSYKAATYEGRTSCLPGRERVGRKVRESETSGEKENKVLSIGKQKAWKCHIRW